MTQSLHACPCGSTRVTLRQGTTEALPTVPDWWFSFCLSCGRQGPPMMHQADAVHAHNARPTELHLRFEVRQLTKDLQQARAELRRYEQAPILDSSDGEYHRP